VLADGSTTPRNLTDRFADVRNVLDYGAVGDGVTDCGPVLRSLIATGGAIYFPAGRYLFNGSYCVIPPNTRLFGEGPGQSIIVPGALSGGLQDPTFRYLFVSRNYDQFGAFYNGPTTPALQTDINITIADLGFDMTTTATAGDPFMIARFLWAAHLRIRNIRADNYSLNTAAGWGGFAFLGCDNYSVDGFYARNVINAIDQWQGCTRAKHSNLWLEQSNGGGNGGLINWQGVGTVQGNGNVSDDLHVSDSTFWLNNGHGLFLDSFAAGSTTQNILLDNLKITAKTGTAGDAIVLRGRSNRLIARGITISADPGADCLPFLLGGYADATATVTGPNLVTTTSGSASLVVAYACRCGVGNYLVISNGAGGAVVGNGVSLNGYYLIAAVGSGTFTVTGPNAASGSGTIAGTTAVRGYYGAAANVVLRDIAIDGCSGRGGALIVAHGHGHLIDGVVVTPNYGASATPLYNCVVSVDTTEAPISSPASCYVGAIVAAAGTGSLPAGYTGDNVTRWNASGLTPLVMPVQTAPVGDSSTLAASTAFATRLLGVNLTTMPDTDTTFTPATTGQRVVNFQGTLTANRTATFPASTGLQRNWFVRQATSGGFQLGFKGVTGPTAWVPTGNYTAELWSNGTDVFLERPIVASIRVGDGVSNAVVVTPGAATANAATVAASGTGGVQFNSNVGFNSTAPVARPTVTGAKGSNAALASLLTALASYGLISDSTGA
jgi:hypothetical protein